MPQAPPLTVTQASSQTGIPKRTIQWAIKAGKLEAHKTGDATSVYLIEQSDLDNWLAQRAQMAS